MKMRFKLVISAASVVLLLIHHCNSSTCESKLDFVQNDTTSTNDYLELNRKFIVDVSDTAGAPVINYPGSRVEHNGFTYYSNSDGLFVQKVNSTQVTKIEGSYWTILLDAKHDLIYFGTGTGLSVSVCGGKSASKIRATDGIAVDFGVVDNIGNVYFGNIGDNTKSSDDLYVYKKDTEQLIKIDGIEQQSLGSYTLGSLENPNKIAVDAKNNVYVGAYSGNIYLIESGQTTVTKLKDMKSNGGVTSIVVDGSDNVYFRTNHAIYTLKSGEKTLTKILELIDDFNYYLAVDSRDNLYFKIGSKTYALKPQPTCATEIDSIDGITSTHFSNLQNFHVKDEVLYFTSSMDGKETIFALTQDQTLLHEVYTGNSSIISIAVDNSMNIYFVASSNDFQKLVPFVLRRNADTPIEIHGVTGHLSHVFSDNRNNIYFGSGNGLHVLQEDEVTPFKLRATESQISSFVVDESDNVYFATDYDGAFVLKSGEVEAVKIDGINTKFGSYVEVYADRRYDVVYFKTGGALYRLNGGETVVKKVIEGESPDLYLSNCLNDVIYVRSSDGNSSIFSITANDSDATNVIDISGQVLHMNSDGFNNLYFITDNNQLHILKPSQRSSQILEQNRKFSSLNVDENSNVYFTTDDGEGYVLRSGENEFKKIENFDGNFKLFVTNGDNSYFVTAKNDDEKGLFLIQNKLQLDTIFTNRNLGSIDSNEDEMIFNILNYLNRNENYLLSRSKNKIVNKTPESATVVATNGKFKGSFNVTYSINDSQNETIRNFDLTEVLTKALFFQHVHKNRYNFNGENDFQNISIITENLKFLPIELTTDSASTTSVEFKNICFNKKRVANTSPLPQTIKVPACNYETKELILFQITSGLVKPNAKNVTDSLGSVLNAHDENIILNFFKVEDTTQSDQAQKLTLSDAFDLSNLNQHTHEIGLHRFVEDEQEIIVPSQKRILVNYSVRTFVLETALNLKQKLKGTIVARIIHSGSEEVLQVTVKEAMQTLKNFDLLPDAISINSDNSVTFNGRAKLIIKRESEPKIIRNFYDI